MNKNRKTREIPLFVLLIAGVLLAVGVDTKADFVFGQAQNAGSVINTSVTEIEPVPEPLSLWFVRRSGPGGAWEYWKASRATEDAPWETPINFGAWVDSYWNFVKILPHYTTADGLELYFYAGPDLSGGYGGYDLWMKKRENIDDDWGPTENLGSTVNSAYAEAYPSVSPDGLELYFSEWGDHTRPGGYGKTDLWVTRRNTRDDSWGEPENLGSMVNTASSDQRPILVGDGLLLFFESNRPGGFGSLDLYMMRRATIADPWTEPINLGPRVNSSSSDEQGFLSPDGSTLYFHSNRPGGYGIYDIWQASVEPVVDLNGDGIVDAADLCIVVDNWGTDEPLCDIGPTPFGDGVVDVQDLIVLAEHLFEEVLPISLIENFDSLAVGTNMHDVNGWEGWQGDAQSGARVTDAVSYSGTNSLEIVGARDDLVGNWPPVTSGAYVLTVMQYVPAATGGQMYFVAQGVGTLLSNCDTGKVYVDELDSATRVEADLLRDQWVELKIVMNLDINSCDFYYGDVLLGTRECFSSQSANMWPNDDVDVVYYDDFRFEPAE